MVKRCNIIKIAVVVVAQVTKMQHNLLSFDRERDYETGEPFPSKVTKINKLVGLCNM